MGSAINGGAEASKVNSWRVAHLSLVLGGIMLFAVSSVLDRLELPLLLSKLLVWSFVISTYGFIVALPYGALIGERGLRAAPGKHMIVYLGNMVGAIGSSIAAIALVFGAIMAIVY